MPFVDTNDDVFLGEKSFETFRTQESSPDMARRAVKSCLPRCGSA
jgi:hypothetical protein